jgi:transient receptor potential cation channel subfamily A protein 1
MLGELDFDRAYIQTSDEQHFPIINLIMLLLFAVIMPILLMNLLVGLAIGDLMQIQQNARLKRLAMQVFSKRIFFFKIEFFCKYIGTISYKSGKENTK